MGRSLSSEACCVIFLGIVCRHGRAIQLNFGLELPMFPQFGALALAFPMPASRLKRGPNRDPAAPRAPNSKRRATRIRSATTPRMTIRMGRSLVDRV